MCKYHLDFFFLFWKLSFFCCFFFYYIYKILPRCLHNINFCMILTGFLLMSEGRVSDCSVCLFFIWFLDFWTWMWSFCVQSHYWNNKKRQVLWRTELHHNIVLQKSELEEVFWLWFGVSDMSPCLLYCVWAPVLRSACYLSVTTCIYLPWHFSL